MPVHSDGPHCGNREGLFQPAGDSHPNRFCGQDSTFVGSAQRQLPASPGRTHRGIVLLWLQLRGDNGHHWCGNVTLPHTATHTHTHITQYTIHNTHVPPVLRTHMHIHIQSPFSHGLCPTTFAHSPWCPQEAKTTWFAFGDDVTNTKQGSFYKLY